MKTYTIGANVTVSIYTRVKANSKEEAIQIAEERQMQTLCHQCSGRDSDDSWSLTGELDGTAQDIKVDDE